MLSSLAQADKSAAELAREMGMSQAAASYHVRTLAAAGLITQTQARLVHGGREKVYGVATAGDCVWLDDLPAGAVVAAINALQRLIA